MGRGGLNLVFGAGRELRPPFACHVVTQRLPGPVAARVESHVSDS